MYYSSPNSPICTVNRQLKVEGAPGGHILKGEICFIVGEGTDKNGNGHFLLRPLSEKYQTMYVLKGHVDINSKCEEDNVGKSIH